MGHLAYAGSLNYADNQNVDQLSYIISRQHIC